MPKRFNSLRFIGSFLKFVGVISLILAVVTLIVAPLALSTADSIVSAAMYSGSHPGSGLLLGVFIGVVCFFLFALIGILLYALGECCNVLLAVEENTRVLREKAEREN